MLTIGAAFSVLKILGEAIVSSDEMDAQHATEAGQICSPFLMQIICSPLHLLALNLYNVPAATAAERARGVGESLAGVTLARMIRMSAAFGIGGVMNTALTHKGRDLMLERFMRDAVVPERRLTRTRSMVQYNEPSAAVGFSYLPKMSRRFSKLPSEVSAP